MCHSGASAMCRPRRSVLSPARFSLSPWLFRRRTHPWMPARVPRSINRGGTLRSELGAGRCLVARWRGRWIIPCRCDKRQRPEQDGGVRRCGIALALYRVNVIASSASCRAAASKAASQAAGRPRATSILSSVARRSSPPRDFCSRGRSMNAPRSDHPWRSGRPLSP